MKKRDKPLYIESGVILLVVLVLVLTGCSAKVPSTNKLFESLNYEVKECIDDGEESLNISFMNNNILVHQIIETNCCFDVELSYKKTDSILRIYEDFLGEECDCNCKREINAEISGKGISEIEFYSKAKENYPYELLLEHII